MAKRERIMMRVEKGGFKPADNYAKQLLAERNFSIGELVGIEIVKIRNPAFNRLAHQLGLLVVENIESFSGLDAHSALKRLQIEGAVACDEIGIVIEGFGTVVQRIPRSLGFESMGDDEFRDTFSQICKVVSDRYWKKVSPEQIEEMASCMVLE